MNIPLSNSIGVGFIEVCLWTSSVRFLSFVGLNIHFDRIFFRVHIFPCRFLSYKITCGYLWTRFFLYKCTSLWSFNLNKWSTFLSLMKVFHLLILTRLLWGFYRIHICISLSIILLLSLSFNINVLEIRMFFLLLFVFFPFFFQDF